MAKLRAVKERKESNEFIANDLRGLSNKGLLENEYPWVYLAVKDLKKEAAESICNSLQLNAKTVPQTNVTIFFDPSKLRNHKSKAVRLVGAAILVSDMQPDSKMLLSQMDVLRFKVTNQSLEGNPETSTEDYQKWDSNLSGLNLNFPVNIYLTHAGFNVGENQSGVHLSATEIRKLTISTAQKTTQRKIG